MLGDVGVALSAHCEFDPIQILHMQRMTGLRGRDEATVVHGQVRLGPITRRSFLACANH
jgi:hypothetical protein